jgi:hypothetical protein
LVYDNNILCGHRMEKRMRGLLQEEEEVTPTLCHMFELTIGNDSSRYDSFNATSCNSSSVSTDDEDDSSSSSAKSTSPSPREYSAMTTDDDDDDAYCSAAASSTSTRTLDRRWNIMVFVYSVGLIKMEGLDFVIFTLISNEQPSSSFGQWTKLWSSGIFPSNDSP